MSRQWTLAGKLFRDRAVKRLHEFHQDRADQLDALLSDPLGWLVRAAEAEGYKREEIRKAIYRGAFNGWSEAREDKTGDACEGETEGYRFARSLGEDNGAALPKDKRLAEVQAAHDALSTALEDEDGGNDAEHDAAVRLCEALNAYYPKEVA